MQTTRLTSLGLELDLRPESFGELQSANELLPDPVALRQRMADDGYLYLREYLDKQQVLATRAEVTRRLAEHGLLDKRYPVLDAVTQPAAKQQIPFAAMSKDNAPLHQLLYTGRMLELFEKLFGGAVRHFDFTWFRQVPGGGKGTYPHCDIVYMGRGTADLYTAWTPIGAITRELGGLLILEGSAQQRDRLRKYLARDVDTYCTNYSDAAEIAAGTKTWQDWDGRLSNNPVSLREKLGGRWLTADFQLGDVVTFGMATVHASLDNQTNRYRLSSDSRYQLASEPVDERWIGPNPIAHGPAGKKGKIC